MVRVHSGLPFLSKQFHRYHFSRIAVCVVTCVATRLSGFLGVNPRSETDLNDTRAIGLSLGHPLSSRG
jgi:hypothetical protein